MNAYSPPRRFTACALALVAFALFASACTGISSPEGWASPVVAPSDDPAQEGLLLASHRDRLFALDAETLDALWAFPTGDEVEDIDVNALYGTPAITESTVFVPAYDSDRKGTLYALDRETGTVSWALETDGPLVGDVIVADDTVYFGSSDGKVYALDAASGETRWAPFETDDAVWSAPALAGDTLYVTSLDSRLYALDAETGRELWSFETDAGIASPPVVNETAGLVYVGGFDSQLRAIDLETQDQRWSVTADNWFWSRPLIAEGILYAGSLDHEVYAVDAGTGEPRWPQPFDTTAPVRSAPVLANGALIIIDKDGHVYAIDPEDGSAAIDEPEALRSGVLADPLVRPAENGTEEILVTTTDGELVRLDGSELRIIERRELTAE